MRLVLLGAPGSGKGTQADFISQKWGIPKISTGDIFRSEIKGQTALGKEVEGFLAKGELVPDDLVIRVALGRVMQEDCKGGFIFDGFPRTLKQAEMLDLSLKLDLVIEIETSLDTIFQRLANRRLCSDCGDTYHLIHNKPKEDGSCDKCKGVLYQRSDDTEEVIKNRFSVYQKITEPLVNYYRNSGVLKTVDGNKEIKQVRQDIEELLERSFVKKVC